MASESETLADILAEIRAYGAQPPPRLMWLEIADRIEAAWNESVCNAAATRAALKTIHDKVNSLDEECGVDPVEIRDIARAALSKPARNCDVMSMYMCTTQFITTYEGNRDGLCDVQTEREKNIHLYYIELIDWLFAPAAERKGDGDVRNIKPIDCDQLCEFLNAVADKIECWIGLRNEGGAE